MQLWPCNAQRPTRLRDFSLIFVRNNACFSLPRRFFGLSPSRAVGSLTPIGVVLLRPLEDRFPQPSAAMPPPTGIIVLGGAVDTARSESRRQVYLDADAARMTAAVELARRYPNARLVFTGGSAGFPHEGLAEAISVRELWLSLGVPAEQMIFEEKSRWHVPRSVGIFRHVGFPVVPYPVAYRTFGDGREFRVSVSTIDRFAMLDLGMREWIGLLAYRLAGKTDALFPAP